MKIDELVERINADLKDLRKIVHKNELLEVYEFYHGDELIMVGSLRGIAEYTTHSLSTLKNYSYPSYLSRVKESKTAPKLIKVSGDSNT